MTRNPKQAGTNIFDCRPQTGPCPINCNQCFYNRPGAFYVPIDKPNIPTPAEVGGGIVRMNCGHDSNFQRSLVFETARQYKHVFFNTSIPRFDFPGPVVFTANPKEEEDAGTPEMQLQYDDSLMFVRLRVSSTNLKKVGAAIDEWANYGVPVVLTFMAYYEEDAVPDKENYEWKVRHINSYWCPTRQFKARVMRASGEDRLVTMCGTPDSNWCRDCRNCETYYWQTIKRMKVNGNDISTPAA